MDRKNNKLLKYLKDIAGTNVNITESQSSKSKKEQIRFCEMVKMWDETWQRNNKLYSDTGIDLSDYDASYYNIIENAFLLLYGGKAELVFWWVYERYSEDGEIAVLVDEKDEEHILKTPLQLYKFIKKLNKNDKIL